MPKKKKYRLLLHEKELLESGELSNITHHGSSSTWLWAPSTSPLSPPLLEDGSENQLTCCCYRHMGDNEFAHLLKHNELLATQPYQTITRGEEGRAYCESYLKSSKYVDTNPTTVVEFLCPNSLVDRLYAIQSKIEDGTRSHGLGSKAGRTLAQFNDVLEAGGITSRIVLVKRARTL